MKKNRIAIIGAGASGMMAALSAAEAGADVTVWEYNSQPGKKLLRTGNGKCNITNLELTGTAYSTPRALDYIHRYDNRAFMTFLEDRGILLTARDNYVYPYCGQAAAIRDLLVLSMKEAGVRLITDARIDAIRLSAGGDYRFILKGNGADESYDAVILSCGSYAGLKKRERPDSSLDGYSLAYSLGARINPVKPALTGILLDETIPNMLKPSMVAGVRTPVRLDLYEDDRLVMQEEGELQFTEYCISGIAAMNISRFVGRAGESRKKYYILADFFPHLDAENFREMMEKRIHSFKGCTLDRFLKGLLNDKLAEALFKTYGLNLNEKIGADNLGFILEKTLYLKNYRLSPKGVRAFEYAQCCSGGIDLDSINEDCMLLGCPGAFVCGEMLDVDAKCGGYNLQWAWSSGYIAGGAAARYVKD